MKKKLALGVLSLLLAATGRAQADTVVATFTSIDAERDIHISINDTFSNPAIAGNEYVATGFYQWTGVSTNPNGLRGNFSTFCIDFTQDIGFGQPPYVFELASLDGAPSDLPVYHDPLLQGAGMGPVRADAIRELWGLDHDQLDNPDKVAGFQLAIWKILYEPTLDENPNASMDLTSGNFKVTDAGDFVGYANSYLASIVSNGQYRTDHLASNLFAITSGEFQDQLVQLPNPPQRGSLVPVPKSVYGGAALIGMLALARKRQHLSA